MPQAINPTKKIVQPARKGKRGGSGLGSIILGTAGAVAGGLAGSFVAPGAGTAAGAVAGAEAGAGLAAGGAIAAGALGGASAGGSLGGAIGEGLSPGKGAQQEVQQYNPTVQLSASEEAIRGQQLLEGVRIANNTPAFAEYAVPLTKGYIQSMINIQKMG